MDNDPPLYKIVLTGNSKAGKSCIIGRLLHDRQPTNDERSTIGVEFGALVVKNAHIEAKLQIWDTAGQERYRAISAAYYRNSRLIIFIFAVTDKDSFTNLPTWIDEAEKHVDVKENCQFLLVGNKTDLPRQVSTDEAQAFAASRNMGYIEVSAMTGDNIDCLLELICETLAQKGSSTELSFQPTNNAETERWRNSMLSLMDHVHDMKFHQIYQIYSPIIKISAPKLLESYVENEVFRVSDDKQLWQKILNNIQFGTREELNLNEISQLVQISIILESSSLKKYAMAQLNRRVIRDKIITVLPNMVKMPFMNEDHKRAVLQYLYQYPISTLNFEKIRLAVDEKTFDDYQIWKNKPRELSPLLEMDSEDEQNFTPQLRFFNMASRLFEQRDLTGDLVLKSGGSDESNPAFSVKVHKLVVAARCDFIKSCLNSNLKEASEGVIEINGFNQEELTALIEYFYTDWFKNIVNPNTCVTILSMAPYLMLTKETNSSVDHSQMLAAVEKTVMDDISDDTCLELALNAHKNEDAELKRIAIKYIIDNYFNVSVKHEDQFSKLPKSLMFTIMNKMILKLAGSYRY